MKFIKSLKYIITRLISCLLLVFAVVGYSIACSEKNDIDANSEYQRIVRNIPVEFEQETVIRSSVLHFRLRGTDRLVADHATITVDGMTDSGYAFTEAFAVEPKRHGDVGDLYIELPVRLGLWTIANPSPSSMMSATFEVALSDALGVVARGMTSSDNLRFEAEFSPHIESTMTSALNVHVGELLELSGNNFLRPDEGTTWAHIEVGHIDVPGNGRRDLTGERLAMQWAGNRNRAYLPIDPAVVGVQVGSFQVSLRFENELTSGDRFDGNTIEGFHGEILPSYIATLSPDSGSRGQKINIVGRGFIPTGEDSTYTMTLRYEGVLTPSDPSIEPIILQGDAAPEQVPDRVVSEQLAEQNVWYSVQNRQLTGFGAYPGVFEGKITPILFDLYGEQIGESWEGSFTILPTKQVVYLKYLPAFSKGLEKYGLENVERDIRDRILEVVHRDYDGINIEFRETEPDDFIDYATIEMGGPDPSGNNAFGYDNTFNEDAKDTGNKFLADYLGGVNAASAAEFNNPYGGIFIESFAFFSPTLTPGNRFASEAFDQILGPFMPALGGKPVLASEWPNGERSGQVQQAILMVANVIANTVSHEIGHSLGMTFYPEDWTQPGRAFHNRVKSGCIMDAGADRPFEVRAELSGHEPAKFNDRNMQYLRQILPLP